jgi:hypothetical protein
MLEILNDVTHPDYPWSRIPDTIENIMKDLREYTLDPTFERYGNFINRNPVWVKPEIAEKYAGCTSIFGNFFSFSHAFRLVTDDEQLIVQFEQAVNENKQRESYRQAKTAIETREAEQKAELLRKYRKEFEK